MPEIDKLFYTVGADTAPFKRDIAALGPLTEQQGAKIASTFKTVDNSIKATHGSASMATREFRALFDELSSGRTRMVPGTLAIIATRVFGISGAALASAAAIAAIPVAFAVAAYNVENAVGRIDNALKRTGFAAGATRNDLLGVANALNSTTGLSTRGAADTLGILASRGNIPLSQLPGAASAAYGYGKATGLSEDKAAEAFEKILSDPKKGAKELYETFKNLTNAQSKQIEEAVATGNAERARQIIIDAENRSTKDLTDNMGLLGKAAKIASNIWFGIGNFFSGGAALTDQQKMDALDARRAGFVAHGIPGRGGNASGAIADIDRQRGDLHYQMRIQQEGAQAAQKQKDQDALDRQVQSLVDSVDVAHKRTQDYSNAIALIAKDLPNLTGKDKAEALRVQGAYRTALRTGQTVEQVLSPEKINKVGNNADYAEQHTLEAQAGIVAAYRQSTVAGQQAEYQLEAEIKLHDKAITSTKDYVAAKMAEAQAKRAIEAIKDDRKQQDENDMLSLEISLLGQDETLRAKKLADLQAENDLKQKGWDLTTAAGQAELTYQQQIGEKRVDLQKTIKDTNEIQQGELGLAREGVGMVGQVIDGVVQGGSKLKSLFPSLESEVIGLVEKLAILNPLENSLTGAITGTAGKLPTVATSGLSKGISSAAGWLTKALGFGLGGAWSGGGVRYAASGMVLGGPTAFHTPSGPVVGGELGKDSEALMPLARGPDGRLGVAAHGGRGGAAVNVTQMINVHPDVSAIARGEIVKAMPALQAAAVKALSAAVGRGFVPGAISP